MDKDKKQRIMNVFTLAIPILLTVTGVYYRVANPSDFLPDVVLAIGVFWLGYKTSEYIGGSK